MRRAILNDEVNTFFMREGYAVVDLLSPSQADELVQVFHELGQAPTDSLRFTIDSANVEYRKRMHDALSAIMKPAIEGVLDNFRIFGPNFVTKVPGGTNLAVHIDNAVVDETKFISLNTWCALHDIDEDLGCLTVVPQSHRWSTQRRAFGDQLNLSPFRDLVEMVENELQQSVHLKKGQAILYHGRTMHGSRPNKTDKLRIVTLTGSRPAEAGVLFHHRVSPTEIEVFDSSEEMYWNDYFVFERPRLAPSLGVIPFEPEPAFSRETLMRRIEACRQDPHLGIFADWPSLTGLKKGDRHLA